MDLTISTANSSSFKESNRYRGTFLHGNLERMYGYDIFSFDKETSFDEGIHQVDINGLKCFFILWKAKVWFEEWRGYLVEVNDPDVGSCLQNYLNKKDMI